MPCLSLQKAIFADKRANTMRANETLKNLDMMMLPVTAYTQVYENEFLLADNFDLAVDSETMEKFVSTRHPFKINFTLLLFCVRGRMRVRWNLKEFELGADDVLVVLPNTIGECLDFSPDCRVAIIAFSESRYVDGVDSTYSMMFMKYLTRQPLIHVRHEEFREAVGIYEAMWKKMQQEDFRFMREVLRGYMQILICDGCQWMSRQADGKEAKGVETRQQMQFDRFLELLQAHYREERSVGFYAGEMCLTPKYLSTIVYRVSGRHAGEWIRDIVVLEAKALLKSRRYTVQQVSDMLHFANASFFGKYFKAAVGCPPRRYMLE